MISLAPHLQRALDSMSKDMGVDQQALVNQAVFAWLRINGYGSPGAVVAAVAPEVVVAAVAQVPLEPVRSMPTPVPVVVAPIVVAPIVVAPIVVAPIVVAPVVVAEVPAPVVAAVAAPVDLGPSLLRMAEIDADLEKLTKPWPAWAPVQAEEEPQEEEEQEDEEEAEPEQEEASHPEPEPEPELPPEPEAEAPVAAQPEQEEEPGLDGNTGENGYGDDDAGESTIVLRSVPIALYLQRDGEEPVKVTTDRFVIGRGPHCDMVIDSPRVSREHVALTRKGVLFYLEDLNSSNGTWLGEERLMRRELESGDVISLGNEPVTFMIRGE